MTSVGIVLEEPYSSEQWLGSNKGHSRCIGLFVNGTSVTTSLAVLLLYAVAVRSALLSTRNHSSLHDGATAVVKEDVDRAHIDFWGGEECKKRK